MRAPRRPSGTQAPGRDDVNHRPALKPGQGTRALIRSPAVAETMRAMGATGDGVELAELPIPTPGSGEVRVKVIASAVNAGEAKIIDGDFVGRFLHAKTSPLVLGRDVAGTVDALGDGVTASASALRSRPSAAPGMSSASRPSEPMKSSTARSPTRSTPSRPTTWSSTRRRCTRSATARGPCSPVAPTSPGGSRPGRAGRRRRRRGMGSMRGRIARRACR